MSLSKPVNWVKILLYFDGHCCSSKHFRNVICGSKLRFLNCHEMLKATLIITVMSSITYLLVQLCWKRCFYLNDKKTFFWCSALKNDWLCYFLSQHCNYSSLWISNFAFDDVIRKFKWCWINVKLIDKNIWISDKQEKTNTDKRSPSSFNRFSWPEIEGK